jgi:hypothetical protein
MRIAARHLIVLNGLTALACLLHVLVHAVGLDVGEWHDYAVYVLVGASFVASVVHGRQVPAGATGTAPA